jgi:hypothetical protein
MCGTLIAQPVPLDVSLAVRGRALAARTFSVLNFNFKKLSLMQIAEWGVADRVYTLAKHRSSSQ